LLSIDPARPEIRVIEKNLEAGVLFHLSMVRLRRGGGAGQPEKEPPGADVMERHVHTIPVSSPPRSTAAFTGRREKQRERRGGTTAPATNRDV
jgi:hypothetical protein